MQDVNYRGARRSYTENMICEILGVSEILTICYFWLILLNHSVHQKGSKITCKFTPNPPDKKVRSPENHCVVRTMGKCFYDQWWDTDFDLLSLFFYRGHGGGGVSDWDFESLDHHSWGQQDAGTPPYRWLFTRSGSNQYFYNTKRQTHTDISFRSW